jgi:hypothetical protein
MTTAATQAGTVKINERGRLRWKTYNGVTSHTEGMAKEWGRANAFTGVGGGWIYKGGKPAYQGWNTLFNRNKVVILDWYTKRFTGFNSFDEMINAPTNYRPTLITTGRGDGWRFEALAEEYDSAQKARRDPRRAHRGFTWFKLAQRNGSTMFHLVNGEHAGETRSACGALFDRAIEDLRAGNYRRLVTDRREGEKYWICLECKRRSGLGQ